MSIPTMRTIDQTAVYIREMDPNTAITKTALRRLIVSGEIPSRKIGAKYLVSIEAVIGYLSGNAETEKYLQNNKIRPIPNRNCNG